MAKVICVVDDQPGLRQMLRFALGLNGLQVVEAENGCDAFEILAAHRVDLMIIDWQMPEMDGLELVRRLRHSEEYAGLPVIMVSCRDDLEARQEARALGVLSWLRKPFRIAEIQQVVESSLGLASLAPKNLLDKAAAGYN